MSNHRLILAPKPCRDPAILLDPINQGDLEPQNILEYPTINKIRIVEDPIKKYSFYRLNVLFDVDLECHFKYMYIAARSDWEAVTEFTKKLHDVEFADVMLEALNLFPVSWLFSPNPELWIQKL